MNVTNLADLNTTNVATIPGDSLTGVVLTVERTDSDFENQWIITSNAPLATAEVAAIQLDVYDDAFRPPIRTCEWIEVHTPGAHYTVTSGTDYTVSDDQTRRQFGIGRIYHY